MTYHAEAIISSTLPDRFALAFEGNTTADSHYVPVFATFPPSNSDGYSAVHIALSLFSDEEKIDADVHIILLYFVLSIFHKHAGFVLSLFVDNQPVNQNVGRKMVLHLIGCASHHFELTLKEVDSERQEVISKVHRLMSQVRSPLITA